MRKRYLLLMAVLILIGSACSSLAAGGSTNAEPVVTPADLAPAPAQSSPDGATAPAQAAEVIPPTETGAGVVMFPTAAPGYPADPEGVVAAFLTAYQDNPQDMQSYLSSGRLADLPEGGVNAFLGITGQLDGFAIQSAAVSPNPPAAVIAVGMVVDGSETSRYFYLAFDYSHWVIDDIAGSPR